MSSRIDELKEKIAQHQHHLQVLKEQEAKSGVIATPVDLANQIIVIEIIIDSLKTELENLENPLSSTSQEEEFLAQFSTTDEIERSIARYEGNLRSLKERQARGGLGAGPELIFAIENKAEEIKRLKAKLESLKSQPDPEGATFLSDLFASTAISYSFGPGKVYQYFPLKKLEFSLILDSPKKLTPNNLVNNIAPYLQALTDLEQIIDEMKGEQPQEVEIRSITQNSPITVSVSGLVQAVTVLMELVVPWRRNHAEAMAKLAEGEKLAQIESLKAEVLVKRIQANKDRTDKEKAAVELAKQRAEVERLNLENEKLRLAVYREKLQLIQEVIDKFSPQLPDAERVHFTTKLLGPLEVLISSEIETLGITIVEDKSAEEE